MWDSGAPATPTATNTPATFQSHLPRRSLAGKIGATPLAALGGNVGFGRLQDEESALKEECFNPLNRSNGIRERSLSHQ